MIKKYEPKEIESKWQKIWEEKKMYWAENNSDKPKKYVLDMFPYPSGAGLHTGHPRSYTATDILARYYRYQGFNVLHPIGWDAFGLPAENYAIKMGTPPKETTTKNIANFTRQIKSFGFSYDWSREINTSSSDYYRWTQWLFLFLYEKGLAYKQKARVNWCESCQTVLANEQVENGACERCKNEVIQKDMEQWFFKITDYADRLLSDLEELDWPEPIKQMQRNWIGQSEGALVKFSIPTLKTAVDVFTTRPDTLFGATYLVLAPEHELVSKMKNLISNQDEVDSYINSIKIKSDLQRGDLNKNKTGVELKGIMAINPANNKPIPVWIADYVLSSYGTGAIMAVPAHDERDWEFARKYNLPVKQVISSDNFPPENLKTSAYIGNGKIINSDIFNGLDSSEAKHAITDKVGAVFQTKYKLRDWLISRQRYWGSPIPIVYDPDGNPHPVKKEHLPLTLPDDVNYLPKGDSPLGSSAKYKQLAEKLYGPGWRFETDTMDTFVCSSWYYFRYTDPQNSEEFASASALRQWLPVDVYIGGAEHAVLHLLYARFINKVLFDVQLSPVSEPFQSLWNQGLIIGEDGRKMSKSLGNVVNPDEMVSKFGADTFRTYEMFMGPFSEAIPWNTDGLVGVRKFLDKTWSLLDLISDTESSHRVKVVIHQTVKKVTTDIVAMKFNTAVSQMMIAVNTIKEEGSVNKSDFEIFLKPLSLFAPFIAEEIWQKLGNNDSVFLSDWPAYEDKILQSASYNLAIQINGKLKDTIKVSNDTDKDKAKELALKSVKISQALAGRQIKKIIFVSGRIINFVLQ